MNARTILMLAALCPLGAVGCENMSQLGGKSSENLSTVDNHFFKVAAVSDMTEIQSSKLALQQSQNSQVRDFAQHMIDEHTMLDNDLKQLAMNKGVTPPTEMDTMHTEMVSNLQGKTGTEFDKSYINAQIMAHKDTIHNVQAEIDNGTDPQVKAKAQEVLPKLQHHLDMAQQLQTDLKL